MKQRGITEIEVEHVLQHAIAVKKSFEDTWEAIGEVNNRIITVKFVEKETYIRIITVL